MLLACHLRAAFDRTDAYRKEVRVVTIRLKRVYEPPADQDGYRLLVDRLWPRGLSKEAAQVDLWLRLIAPTTELRQWYGHEVSRWPEFQARYREELSTHTELLDLIRDIERHRKVITLLFGAKDESHNEAIVLLDVLENRQVS
jgi:DNA-3-methyladenine glycosylase